MLKKSAWTTMVLGAVLIMPVGCTTAQMDAFFAETVADSRKFHEVTRKEIAEHDTNMTKQHQRMHPEAAADIGKLKTEFDAKVAALKKEADAIHSSVGENAKKLVEMIAKIGTKVMGLNGQTVSALLDSAVTEEATTRVAGMTAVNDKIQTTEDKMRKQIEEQLVKLSDDLREKLASTSQETFAKLTSLKGDEAAFREALKSELQLSPAEREQLKGMTTEQILAMIAAAMGAAGAGGALGKTGKSRGHAEIEKLKDAINEITTAAALEKPSPSASTIVAHGTPPKTT